MENNNLAYDDVQTQTYEEMEIARLKGEVELLTSKINMLENAIFVQLSGKQFTEAEKSNAQKVVDRVIESKNLAGQFHDNVIDVEPDEPAKGFATMFK